MNTLFLSVKKIPFARSVVRRARGLLRRIMQRDTDFPTDTYRFTKTDAKKIYSIVRSGKLHHNSGIEVSSLEKEFAKYHNQKHAYATSTGTTALELALKSIGIQPGDEVIIPAYTNIATAQAVLEKGGIPIFADIDDTFTISPASIKKLITSKTRAILPVHMFGNVADMEAIMILAKKHSVYVIEDCCQAIGATYANKKVGTFGDVGCFSFNAKKAIFTGQGGMVITSNKRIYTRVNHFIDEVNNLHIKEGSDVISSGHMYEMTEMQASLARSILSQLDQLNRKRLHDYEYFVDHMDTSGIPLRWYRVLPKSTPAYSRLAFLIDFQRLTSSRDKFIHDMRGQGIPMKTYYPRPLYTFSLFKNKRDGMTGNRFPFSLSKVNYRTVRLPYVEQFCKQLVGMEFSPYLTPIHINHLTSTLRRHLLSIT